MSQRGGKSEYCLVSFQNILEATVVQIILEYYVKCLLSKYLDLNKLNVHCLIMINFGRLSNKTENMYMYIIYIFNEPIRIYISSTISVDLNTGI